MTHAALPVTDPGGELTAFARIRRSAAVPSAGHALDTVIADRVSATSCERAAGGADA